MALHRPVELALTFRDLGKTCDKRQFMASQRRILNAAQQCAISGLYFLVAVGATGCSSQESKTNLARLRRTPAPKTIQIFASSSLGGRPMGEDSSLHGGVAKAFQRQFPGARLVETKPDMVVFFTIVDYVPGCLPNCTKFKTYRNWSCEVEIYAVESESKTDTLVFNLNGSTYDPFYNPASNCASRLTKTIRSLN
jgi:hypothetical protein